MIQSCTVIPGWENVRPSVVIGPCSGGTEITAKLPLTNMRKVIINRVVSDKKMKAIFTSEFLEHEDEPALLAIANMNMTLDRGLTEGGLNETVFKWSSPASFRRFCRNQDFKTKMILLYHDKLLDYKKKGSTSGFNKAQNSVSMCSLGEFTFEEYKTPPVIWISVLFSVASCILIGCLIAWLLYRKRLNRAQEEIDKHADITSKFVGSRKHLVLKSQIKNINKNPVGKGNFGIVYRSGKYACKALKRDGDFLEEVGIQPGMPEHKHVVKYVGLYVPDNDEIHPIYSKFMIVTEFMENGGLDAYLKNPAKIVRKTQMLQFVKDASKGLKFLTEQKIIHRDIAARNCMLDEDLNLKITDFGLARPLDKSGIYKKADESVKLPIPWLALESLQGHDFTPESDLWMFGVLVWEIFTRCKFIPYFYMSLMTPDAIINFLKCDYRLSKPNTISLNMYGFVCSFWNEYVEERPVMSHVARFLENAEIDCDTVVEVDDVSLEEKQVKVSYTRGGLPSEPYEIKEQGMNYVVILKGGNDEIKADVGVHETTKLIASISDEIQSDYYMAPSITTDHSVYLAPSVTS